MVQPASRALKLHRTFERRYLCSETCSIDAATALYRVFVPPPRTPPKSLGLRKTTRFLKTVGRQFHSSQGPDAIVLKVPRL